MRRRLNEGPAALEAGVDEKRTEVYYWWLLLAIFFEYARPGAFVPVLQAAKLNSLIPLSLFVLVAFGSGFRPFRQIYEDRQVRWLTVFLGLILFSVPFAMVPRRAIDILTFALGYYLLFMIIARVVTSARRLLGTLATLVVAHLFLIGMTPDIVLNNEVRVYIAGGTFLGDGNDFSASLCILIPMTILVALRVKRRWLSRAAWFAVVIFMLAIVGSQSRGATLGLGAVAVFLWLLSKRKVASLMGIGLAAMIMIFHASDSYFARMSSISAYQTEGSAQGRIKAWKSGARMALDNPILGVGAGSFPIAFGTTYRPKELVGPMPWLTAHSSYFLVLGELGFPGIVAFMALVIGGFRSTMTVRRRMVNAQAESQLANGHVTVQMLYLMSAGMVGFAVAGAFLSAAYYPHIFVLTALLYCARTIAVAQLKQTAATEPKPALAGGKIVGQDRARIRTGRGSGT